MRGRPTPATAPLDDEQEGKQMIGRPSRLAAALGALVLVLTGCATGAAHSGGGTTLRLALNQSEDHPSFTALENFGERLGERTGGRWNIDVHPNSNLGSQLETLQLTSDGSVDLAIVSGTQLENLDRDFVVFNLPHVFDSIEHQMEVINDPGIVGDLYSSLEHRNLTVLGGFTQGARSVYSSRGPVTAPADLAGQKIRVQESEVHSDMLDMMGGSATPMSYGEVYTALQSGVLDGAENNEVSYVTQKHYEVAPHFSRTEHLIGLDYLVANTGRLARMPAADRAVFDAEWNATMREFTALWARATEDAIAELRSRGVRFHEVDAAAFREALAPLTERALDEAGASARTLYERARAAAR
ncbi:TRAP transporter substrate-binding protein [Saccharopolyspora cebuensis]|uniref:TRAP transporter substrate-binding protein n=1 Tax=Saccharopolyspora cebuensis TaxID=418759 RepID=A0ABV4CEU5_9PSEU